MGIIQPLRRNLRPAGKTLQAMARWKRLSFNDAPPIFGNAKPKSGSHLLLQIMGGLDKTKIAKDKAAIDQELEKLPLMLRRSGYIPYLDHLVPPEVPWDLFVYYRQRMQAIIEKTSISK